MKTNKRLHQIKIEHNIKNQNILKQKQPRQ
jgi:hypothetical protein